ncbi:MAG: ASPIC/UnbV domain-containing protein, partial [Acidobacteriota bacterium]
AQFGGFYRGDWWPNALYENGGSGNHWLQVDLRGVTSNRFAIGAQLILRAGTLIAYREVKGSEGFGSTDPFRVSFGLAGHRRVDSLQVVWPSGVTHLFEDLEADQAIRVVEDQPRLVRIR